jgi:hypothetical protein
MHSTDIKAWQYDGQTFCSEHRPILEDCRHGDEDLGECGVCSDVVWPMFADSETETVLHCSHGRHGGHAFCGVCGSGMDNDEFSRYMIAYCWNCHTVSYFRDGAGYFETDTPVVEFNLHGSFWSAPFVDCSARRYSAPVYIMADHGFPIVAIMADNATDAFDELFDYLEDKYDTESPEDISERVDGADCYQLDPDRVSTWQDGERG